MQPGKVQFTIPQVGVDLKFDEIEVEFQHNQYVGLVLLLDSVDRLVLRNKFWKYKSLIESKNYPRASTSRWLFAYTAVLEEIVRRRSNMWSWKHIQEHRQMVREYTALWRKRLLKESLTPEQEAKLEYFEDELNVMNLALARQHAEVQAAKSRAAKESSRRGGGGWFSWFLGGSSSAASATTTGDTLATCVRVDGPQMIQRVQQEMTPEEKEKLYAALNYSEGMSRCTYPPEYVSTAVKFSLGGLAIMLANNDLKNPGILKVQLNTVTSDFKQRVGDNAMDFSVRLAGFEVVGPRNSSTDTAPILISSAVTGESLLSVDFAKNPIDRTADRCLFIAAAPLDVIYDADTVNKIVDFFKLPPGLRLDEISSSVMPSLDEMKAMTTAGLRHLLSRRTCLDLRIDIQPSCFLLPERGVYIEGCRLIMVDFGSVSLRSMLAHQDLARSETTSDQVSVASRASSAPVGRAQSDERYMQLLQANYEQLLLEAYDQFEVTLSTTQIILVQKGENWRELRSLADTPGHVLKPLGIKLVLRQCIAPLEFGLPQFQVDGRLPLLGIDFTDKVLESLCDIIAHVPLPETDPSQRIPTDPNALLKDVKFFDVKTEDLLPGQLKAVHVLRMAETALAPPSPEFDQADDEADVFFDSYETPEACISSAVQSSVRKPLANLVMICASFLVEEIRICMFEQATSGDIVDPPAPMLKFVINGIGADFTLRKWDQEMNAHVNRLSLKAPRFKEYGSGNELCLIDTFSRSHDQTTPSSEHLFTAHLLIADKSGPDFATKYANTRHCLVCEFRVLKIHLHQEALVSLLGFFTDLAKVLAKDPELGAIEDKNQKALEWANRLGDTEASEHLQTSSVMTPHEARLSVAKTTPVDAVSGLLARKNERRDIRLDAVSEAAKMGRYLRIPEVDATQWKIQLTLDKVQVFFCSSEMQLMAFSMRGMRVDLRMTYLTTEIAMALSDICISDLNETSLYRQILWIEPGANVFLMQTVLYNRGTKALDDQYDPEKVDVAVSLQFGKAHVIMLYWFLRRVVCFMDSFKDATEYAIEKASEVTGAAKTQIQEVVNQPLPPRLALSVNVEAPVIYMPQNSTSRTALVFDLGRISIKNHFEVIPKPVLSKNDPINMLMMDCMSVRLEDFKMSAAILVDGGVEIDRNVIQPINLSLNMNRKVFSSKGDGVPQLDVSGALESIRLSMTYGDYKLINEVFLDNFEEADSLMGSLPISNPTNVATSEDPVVVTELTTQKTADVSTSDSLGSASEKSAFWTFVLRRLEIELFRGTDDPRNWNDEIHASRRLGVFTCTELFLEGDSFDDTSSNMMARLKDISLIDTRPHSDEHITNILSQAGDSQGQMSNFIEVLYHSDNRSNQTLNVNVCSIMVCASLDYFMILSKFFTEGAHHRNRPAAKPSPPPSQRTSTMKHRQPQRTTVSQNPSTLRIKTNIADPEIVLPEDMSNPNCNAILVTTSLNFDYAMLREETVMNASITKFRILACPFDRSQRGKNSMEVVVPTSVSFYARQPVAAALHGSINMESLLINVNAPIIRSISRIMNQLTESAMDVSLVPQTVGGSQHEKTLGDDGTEDFWSIKPVKASDIPIPMGQVDYDDSASEGTEGCDVAGILMKVDDERVEKILIRINYVCLSMESQIGNKQVPMLLMEAHIDGEMKSPSTALGVSLYFELAVSYYNDHVNEWEQLLETLPTEGNRLWSLQVEYHSAEQESSYTKKEWQELSTLQNSGRLLTFISQDNLEITISKTALDVLSKLGKSFEEAYVSPRPVIPLRESVEIKAPYVLRNQTGLRLMVVVDGQRLRTTDKSISAKSASSLSLGAAQQKIGLVGHVLEAGQNLGFYDVHMNKIPTVQYLRSAPLAPPRFINIGLAPKSVDLINDWGIFASRTAGLKIHRTANYIVSAVSINAEEKSQPIVATITAFLGQKTLFLQSTLQVVNETPKAIRIFSLLPLTLSDAVAHTQLLAIIAGGGSYSLPVEIVTNKEITGIRMCPDLEGAAPSTDVIYWPPKVCPQTAKSENRGDTCIYLLPRLDSGRESEWPVQEVGCSVPLKAEAGAGKVLYNYTITMERRFPKGQDGHPDFLQPPSSTTTEPVAYNMVIRAPASLHNHLPVPITFYLCDAISTVEPGHTAVLSSVKSSGFSVSVNFTYNKKDYLGAINISNRTEEMSLLPCETQDGYDISLLNLGLRCSRRLGHIDLTVYCPYWLVNKTGLSLTYKDQNELEFHHPAGFSDVFLFSVTSKTALLQHKIVMRTEDSLWSSKFSLDTVGSWGRVHCEGKLGRSYEIGVKINLSASGLTKIITFMPYFMIVNKTPVAVECAQVRDIGKNILDTWIPIKAGDVKPFWPATGDTQKMLMTCRVDQKAITDYFPLYESNTVLLKLPNPYIGLYTDVQTTDEATVINLQLYKEGMALVHIINDMDGGRNVHFYQKGTGVTHTLKSGYQMFYTWDDASKPRQFFTFVDSSQKTRQVEITTDSYETFVSGNANIHVVSFLSKLQRTLLFTNDPIVANLTAKSGELESVTDRISLVLQSVGISLVTNQLRKEVCYISIRSSDIIWNKMRRGNRLKPLKPDVSEALEDVYNTFLNRVAQNEDFPKRVTLPDTIRPTTTVDLNQMVMLEPENCTLQRTFEPGMQIQYRASPNQIQIHAKIFRVQVDSQRLDAHFPVVFAPFPQPASVVVDSGSKALVEVFTVICKTTDEEVYRFKRLECLIQEMQFQLDQGFLNDMIDFFAGSVIIQDELVGFLADQKLTSGALVDAPVVKDVLQTGRESIIDYIHISPIKMHVSFSLLGSSQESQPSALHSDVLKLFLQSLGVALTDVQDVVFKLGYFERRGRIMSFSKILTEMGRYYAGQAIKQTYVLILGLDVIGNPFGVIRGMAQGVEDLFYEPVKGAVVGTEEFAEGVALGVKSLFGHTVGGAAGAMSRITGTLGKGVAALTLDDEYKRRRREEMIRTPDNFGAGMARGGKGLVMGVVGGVTGIITQPILGARKEGVEGFFKGLGKGLIGTVTRPVSGMVDFASSSFEGIRRATSTSKDVLPVRPPRFIHLDGVIRPYDRNEAEGSIILSRLRDRSPSEDYVFHIPLRRNKGICMLTTERILLVTMNEILGSCTIDWQAKLSQLSDSQHKYECGLELQLGNASKTKLFGGTSNVKQIECTPDNAMRMLTKIRMLVGEDPSDGQTIPSNRVC
ncbi:Vacuolar protein sorting associated protein 13A [Echinococcus multilocularis]|uniref:Vacuolar protein sorting associated protein 13A n=1 Tax=Echinococcus multilocularis TaxID=6211 RepID=A0A068Y6L9_ECHMU|nr:Vacuolar protein sorting associated protein 13A [Echinococcus multilocularis]